MDQSALALTIGMGGVILLLLIGTQILEWYWVALLTVVSLGVGLYRLRNRIPAPYQVAQRIDRTLKLSDVLSTAAYFSDPGAGGNPAVREQQRRVAEDVARTVDVQAGLPFVRSRFMYPAVALAAVAFGLFALRFAVTGSLSLQPSLVQIAYETFFSSKQVVAKNLSKRPFKGQFDPNSPQGQLTDSDSDPDTVVDSAGDSSDPNNPDAQGNSKSDAKDSESTDAADDQSKQGDKGGDQSGDKDSGSDDSTDNSSKQGDKNGKQDSKAGSDRSDSSMMDKVKDAMSSLWAKMKPQNEKPQQGQQNGQSQAEKSNQKGESQNKQSPDSDAQGEPQDGDGGDKKPSSEAGSAKGSDSSAAPNSKSGIGNADGDKATKLAEQLAAMGKISEILGKRSANVTGEVMVEVGSSKQQLKTPWAQRQAAHSEAGGEIHRDEVPLIYQPFVEQYFEEIRKAPASKPAAPKSAPAKPGKAS